MTQIPKGVTLLLEDLQPVLDMALRWHQRHVGGQSCTAEHSRAIRTVTQEFEAAGGSLEPSERRSFEPETLENVGATDGI